MPPFVQERHIMRLLYHWPSGAQSYICAECGRLVVVEWLTMGQYRKVVLDHGAADIQHTMLRERPNEQPTHIPQENDEQRPDPPDNLDLWRDGLQGIDGL